jgi:hypothetical protein
MEKYLYFRKFRPASQSFTITSTNVTNWANIDQGSATSFMEITGLGGDDIDSETEIASVTVTAVGINSNVGSNYSGGAVVAGEVVTLDLGDAVDINNSKLRIEPASGSGSGANKDTANGYTLVAGDIVTVTLQQGLETCAMYPVSGLMSVTPAATGSTVFNFKSLKANGTIDTFTVAHANGKYEEIVNAINAIQMGKDKGGIVKVIDGGEGGLVIDAGLAGCGITGFVYAPTASY